MTREEQATLRELFHAVNDARLEQKADLQGIRAELMERFDQQDARLGTLERFQSVTERIEQAREQSGITKRWIVGTMLAAGSILVTVTTFVLRWFGAA